MSLDERLNRKIAKIISTPKPDDYDGPDRDISFDEFKVWLKGFVQGKGYKLPNWDDWDVIMTTADNISWFSTRDIACQSLNVTMTDLEQLETLTVGEFQQWLKALWMIQKNLVKQLPGIEEWKKIKAMMDKVVEEEMLDLKIQPIENGFIKAMEELIGDFPLDDRYKKPWGETLPYQPYTPSTLQPIWVPSTTGTLTITNGAGGGTGSAGGGTGGGAGGDFVVSNVTGYVNCNEVVTFTVGVDSALDGANASYINGKPVSELHHT